MVLNFTQESRQPLVSFQYPYVVNALPSTDIKPQQGTDELFISPPLRTPVYIHMLGDQPPQTGHVEKFHVQGKAGKRRHPGGLFLNFVLERQRTLCHNRVTSLVIEFITKSLLSP
jgi:hypothetical protein